MAPFDRSCTSFYWSAIVNIALSCTVFELFDFEYVTLKSELEVTQDHSKWYHSKAWVRFPIRLPSYWSKIVIFFHTPLHSAPLLRGPRRNIVIPFGAEKLEWWGYPIVKKTLRICVTVYTQYRRVTDRQTDGQTDILPRHSPRYAYASRGKNY